MARSDDFMNLKGVVPVPIGFALLLFMVPVAGTSASGDLCGPQNPNSCFAHNFSPGCNDAACCTVVCALDPYCCQSQWDETCAVIASEACEQTSVCPGAGSCYLEHAMPGCADSTCCNTVCGMSAGCCAGGWTSSCAGLALEFCAPSPGCPGAGDCLGVHGTPGCVNASCCSIVCAHQPSCCAQPWGVACVELALLECGGPGTCPGNGDCYSPHPSSGCADAACCARVCANDPYCCQTAWDFKCVGQALSVCAGVEACGGDGNCFIARAEPGCEQVECCSAVCMENPECCFDSWGPACVALAEVRCQPEMTCPADGRCVEIHESPGCDDAACCEAVCAADRYCCESEWDEICVSAAVQWCDLTFVCPGSGSCHSAHEDPGCDDVDCCAAVCRAVAACCIVEWGPACVEAATVCGTVGCPPGTILSAHPPDGTVDARQPHPVGAALPRMGIGTPESPVRVTLDVTGAASCFELCETLTDALLGPNAIAEVVESAPGVYVVTLTHALTAGGVTTIRYLGDGSFVSYFAHPSNANGDGVANPVDILFMIDVLNGVTVPPHGPYSTDVDHSGASNPSDILRLIDLLNGAGAFETWNGTTRPVNAGNCP